MSQRYRRYVDEIREIIAAFMPSDQVDDVVALVDEAIEKARQDGIYDGHDAGYWDGFYRGRDSA